MIVTDLHDRLTARLPASVPVLLPSELLIPAEWQEEDGSGELVNGGERGLHVYLRQQAAEGYVQLYPFQPIMTTSGIYDEEWASIDAIAATSAVAEPLARQIRALIGGTPRTGGNIRLIVPPRTERDPVSVRITLQFQVRSAHPR